MTPRFGKQYYETFYGRDPVHTPERIAHLATAVYGMCRWLELEVSAVLDVGAGPGYWRDWFAANHPEIRYLSTDVSEYACKRFGHERRDITTWQPEEDAFDLVVCHGVFQYLDDDGARAAIEHVSAATTGMMYLELPTSYDRVAVIDSEHTDLAVHWRDGDWYRDLFEPHFRQLGAGMWLSRHSGIPLYELEGASR